MEELTCWDCGEHVGWMSDAGPHGFVQCDECYECYEKQQAEIEESED